MKTEQTVIALLGSVDHEGIVSVLKTTGYVYQKKLLESSRENWGTIIQLVEGPDVEAVLAKLTPSVYYKLADPLYERVGDYLLSTVIKKPNIVFVYDSLYEPIDLDKDNDELDQEDDTYEYKYAPHFQLPEDLRAAVNEKLRRAGVEPICYSTNAQLTVIGTQFLRDLAAKLIFRIYIPHGRLYSTEIDKLLQLFKDFLDNTGRRGITLNKVAAEQGTSFEFCGEYQGDSSLSKDFEDFSQFMEMCVSDVDQARKMLALKNADSDQIAKIITRYTKEARRLFLDVTHERESRILTIRHRLESELVDALPQSATADEIRAVVDNAIPTMGNLTNLIAKRGASLQSQRITVNLNPQIIEQVHGVVVREITGDIGLGPSAEQLVELISKHGGDKAAELTNDVHEAGDRGVPEGTRLTRKNRLKSFFYGLGPEVAKVGVHLLEDYLKSKIS